MKSLFKCYTGLAVFMLSFSACENFVDPGIPKSQLISESVFSNDASALSATAGMYASLSGVSLGNFINYSVTVLTGLMADELISANPGYLGFYQNSLLPAATDVENIWKHGYSLTYKSNALIEGLTASSKLTPKVKQQLLGEAKLMRALCHFYLANLYGDIPYIRTTNYALNNMVSRMPMAQVYQLMIQDLTDAGNLLTETYPSAERVRPNKWAAFALLARVYLYQKDWINAEKMASLILLQSGLYKPENLLKNTFVKSSEETIWQLKPSVANFNTVDGNRFILTAAPTNGIYMRSDFAKSFEKGDLRKTGWVDSLVLGSSKWHYPAKYKIKSGANPTEYLVLFRLSEQFLIQAEAYLHLNKKQEAISALDVIRKKAGLPLIKDTNPDLSQNALLLAIEQERKAEFFSEMGHRWFDLKRTDRANLVLQQLKAPNWTEEDQLMPIPKSQMDRDNHMVQNPGYFLSN